MLCGLSLWLWLPSTYASDYSVDSFPDLKSALASDDSQERDSAIEQLARSTHPDADALLTALEDGLLYKRVVDQRLVKAQRNGASFDLKDVFTDESLPSAGRRDVRRISINNQQRSSINLWRAEALLASTDETIRLQAVKDLTGKTDPEIRAQFESSLVSETDKDILTALGIAVAVAHLRTHLAAPTKASDREDANSQNKALNSVAALSGALHPEARKVLGQITDSQSSSAELRMAAASALAATQRRLEQFARVETLFFGVSMGSVLVLAAIGLSITFGVMGVINMAHGELIMLGAYTTYSVQQLLPGSPGTALLLSIPCAFLVAAIVGMAIERGVIRHLYGRSLETLLATFGISLILQQSVRSIFSPLNRSVTTPDFVSGSLELTEGLELTWVRIYIVAFSLTVFFGILLLMKFSRVGLEIRAVAENRQMANALGVRTHWVDALTFGLGSGIAGIAGVALSLLTNVGPNMGQSYIIDSFLVVVSGGVGNLWGTLVAGLSIGAFSKLLEPTTGAVLAKVIVLVSVILFIQWRPRGLFPPRGRSAEP